jgi:hypothetical protein
MCFGLPFLGVAPIPEIWHLRNWGNSALLARSEVRTIENEQNASPCINPRVRKNSRPQGASAVGAFFVTQGHSRDLCHPMKTRYKQTMQFCANVALSVVLLCLPAVPPVLAQESQHKTTAPRPLTRHEGLAIVHAALQSRHRAADCSHLVHSVYERAGFPYDYAPSSDLYAGIDEFRGVTNPHPGDLAVWHGHAGIVVNPAQHSFFSTLSSGPGVDSWDSPYWSQWGRPHFFRYLKHVSSDVLSSTTRNPTPKQ